MKKVSLLSALLLMATIGIGAAAAENEYDCSGNISSARQAVKQSRTIATHTSANGKVELEVKSNPTLITEFQQAATPQRVNKRTKSVTSVADLEGYYVMTFASLTTDGYDGGVGVYVSQIEDTDSILITDFYDIGFSATAKVDISDGSITLASQVVGTSSSYGDITLAVATSSGTSD